MRYFYVDTENIQSYEFLENWGVNSDDYLFLFLSQNSKNIKLTDLKKITTSKAKLEYENVPSKGKNAMDFQIVTTMAINIFKESNAYHYVVSDDNDFMTAISCLQIKSNAKMYIIKPSFDNNAWSLMRLHKDAGKFHNSLMSLYGQDVKELVYKTYRDHLLREKSKTDIENKINELLELSSDLNTFRNSLRSEFGDSKGNDLYWSNKKRFIESKRVTN